MRLIQVPFRYDPAVVGNDFARSAAVTCARRSIPSVQQWDETSASLRLFVFDVPRERARVL
jgi:hypothetical protein